MTSSPVPAQTSAGVLDRLNKASSAEDFFALLGVTYDPKVVNVARLHILKRMGQYLAGEDFEGLPDSVVTARCKSVLERAYEDFVASSPLDQRVFKVLKEAAAQSKSDTAPAGKPAAFVPLDMLK
jgi:nitrogenase-stabilizing/protective protein